VDGKIERSASFNLDAVRLCDNEESLATDTGTPARFQKRDGVPQEFTQQICLQDLIGIISEKVANLSAISSEYFNKFFDINLCLNRNFTKSLRQFGPIE